MTVIELIKELSKYPEDTEVVYDSFEGGPESYNFITGAYVNNGRLHLYEE